MGYSIERYLNIKHAYGASVDPVGRTVAFLMDTTGVPQIWTMEAPRGWPTQRTFYDDRITFCSWSPTRRELLFAKDDGGNERDQFFLLEPATGTIDALTARPDAKHLWGGWSWDGERFAFASNRRDEGAFDLYLQSRTERGDEATLVYQTDGWFTPAGWSPSGDRLLVHEARASFDHDLHLFDLEAGDLTALTDHPEPTQYTSPTWHPDGESIYLSTDEGEDTRYLGHIDVATADLASVRSGDGWNVEEVAVPRDDPGRLVFTTNVDGFTRVTIAEILPDGSHLETGRSALPEGVSGGISFYPGGGRFAISAHSRAINPNVFVVDVAGGEATRWTDAATAGIPRRTFRRPSLVRFESFDGLEVPALFTLPATVEPDATPVIVDIHGGPESQRRPGFSAVQQYFLDRGYALFEPNVRGSSGYGRRYAHLDDVENRMDAVADIGAALDWLADHQAVDADRVVAFGGSYGGFMVLASLVEYPERWAAGVDIVGIANFVTFLENTGDWRRELREAEYGSLEQDRAFLESISPINHVDRIEAPLFVLHGANDPRVPVDEAAQIVEALRGRGVPVEKLIFDDEGHGIAKRENRIEAYAAIADFLEIYAPPSAAAGRSGTHS